MKANMSVLAQRYAKAYDLVAKNDNAAAQKNYELFKEALSSLKPVEEYINNPTISPSVKLELASKAYGNADTAASFVKLLISAGRYYLAGEIAKELQNLLDARLGIKRATVFSAGELDDGAKRGLGEALSKYFNSALALDYKTDASLLSGVVILCGDLLIDASAEGRIKQMTKILTER